LVFSCAEQADVSSEVKRAVLLAFGAKVVVAGGEAMVELDLPLVIPAPPAVRSAGCTNTCA
jgi:hypothetical protein